MTTAAWLFGSQAGRILLAGAAGLLALWWLYGEVKDAGRQEVRVEQLEEERDALRRSDQAGADYRGDGGAAGRLRDGRF